MIFSFIKRHCNKNKKFIFSLVLFLGIFFLLRDFAFATDSANSTQTNVTDWKKTADWLKLIFSVSAALIGVLTSLVSLLLFPGWTSGNIIGLDTYMKEIWILVSNVVYFIFAFILIYIAVMNIVGQGKDTYQLKTALPRFIIGVLIVPFSWFFVQFILSISAFLSVASLSLPYSTFQGMDSFTEAIKDKKICSNYQLHLSSGSGQTTKGTSSGAYDIGDILICKEGSLKNVEEVVNGKDQKSLYGLIYLYTYGILSLDKLDEFDSDQVNNFQTFFDAIQKVLFDMIFIVVYAILMFALFIALFVRGFMFWLYAMASPVIGLSYFLKKKDGGGIMKHFNITQIIHLALVPVYVCLALSFGYLFLLVAGEGMETGKINTIIRDGKYEFAGFTLDINGAFGNTTEKQVDNKVLITKFGSIMGKIIIELFGIAIIRLAIMAALKTADITKEATASISKLGDDAGKTLARLPAITPIPGTGLSADGLSHISGRLKTKVDEISTSKAEDFIGKNSFLDGVLNDPASRELTDALRGLKNEIAAKNKPGISQKSGEIMFNLGTVEKVMDKKEYVAQIAEGVKQQGSPELAKKLVDATDHLAFEKAVMEIQNRQVKEFKKGMLGDTSISSPNEVEIRIGEGHTSTENNRNNDKKTGDKPEDKPENSPATPSSANPPASGGTGAGAGGTPPATPPTPPTPPANP
ncbi:hypothetical protein HGA92_02015 [Candidatus Gracilibacteria bacterium]|nr:hypothetical protein [Candidatus Gracilibacteria bacterium]NUJ99446.1 hypothetical protein [Candidatus Gracilibacteria bacterium]